MRELGIIPATPKSDDMSSLGIIPAQRASKSASGSNGYSPHNAAKSLVGDILNAREFQRGAKQGVTNVARGAYNLAQPALSHIPGLGKYINPMTEQQGQVLNPGEEKSGYAQLGKFAGEAGPIALGGEAAIPSLVARGIPKLAASAATYAGLAGATTPGSAKERGEQALVGGAGSLAGELAPYAIKGGKESARYIGKKLVKSLVGDPGKIVKGSPGKTALIIKKAERAVPEGVKPSIADLADARRGKELGSLLEGVPFSGTGRPGKEAAEHYKSVLSEIGLSKGEISKPDVNTDVQLMENWTDKYKPIKEETDKNYKEYTKELDSKYTPVDQEGIGKISSDVNKIIGRDLSDEETPSLTKKMYAETNDDISDILKKSKDYKSISQNITDLNKKIGQISSTGDRTTLAAYQKTKVGLEDILDNVKTSNERISTLRDRAKKSRIKQGKMEKFNNNDFTPFYQAYVKGEKSPNISGIMIQPGKKAGTAVRNSKYLSDHITDKKLLSDSLAQHLQAEEKNPQVVINRLEGFRGQLEHFLGKEKGGKAKSLLDFEKAAPKILSQGLLPATGKAGAKIKLGVSSLQGVLTGLAALHPGILGIAAAPSVAARATSNILRSPTAKSLYRQEVLGKSPKILMKELKPTLRALLGAGVPAKTRQSNKGGQ